MFDTGDPSTSLLVVPSRFCPSSSVLSSSMSSLTLLSLLFLLLLHVLVFFVVAISRLVYESPPAETRLTVFCWLQVIHTQLCRAGNLAGNL